MRIVAAAMALLFLAACAATRPASDDFTFPPETVVLRTSPLPGYAIAMQKCGICHSADYIAYQPPAMTVAQWTAEMAKMQHAYGAPISDEEVKLLGIYLASAYGNAKQVTAADAVLKPTDATARR